MDRWGEGVIWVLIGHRFPFFVSRPYPFIMPDKEVFGKAAS
jgi:hypothetical protein